MRKTLIYAFVCGMAMMILLPFVPIVIWSFSHSWYFPDVFPELSTRAWEYVFSGTSKVGEGFWNSLVVAFFATIFSVLIGIPAGRALGMYKFKGKRLIELLVLAPAIIPPLSVVMGIHVMFIRYGLVETHLGVILVHLIPTLPYMVMVLSGIFANYQVEYEHVARSLGAGPVRTFFLVTFPMILPGVMISALFAFLISWSQYVLTVMIGGGKIVTLPMLLFSFVHSGNNAIAAAICLIFVIPALVLLVFTSKYLSGSTAGGFGRL